MIAEWFLNLAVTVNNYLAGLFPDWDVPDFFTDFDATVNSLLASLSGVAVWADWAFILTVVSAVVIVWAFAFLVKLARAVLAHVPFVGGSG